MGKQVQREKISLVADNETGWVSCHKKLWCMVIINAIKDASLKKKNPRYNDILNKNSAIFWLFEDDDTEFPSFAGICREYDLDMDGIRDLARRVIAGPETGPRARPCPPGAIENLYEQCKAAGIPFFDKRPNYLAREYPR